MPKLLVLFDAATAGLAPIAAAVADGARGVRFMEVDVRRLDAHAAAGDAAPVRPLASLDELAAYDAIVLGAAAGDAAPGGALAALLAHLAALGPHGALRDRVGATFVVAAAPAPAPAPAAAPAAATPSAALDAMARAGLLLVPPGDDTDPARRVALALALPAVDDEPGRSAARALGHRAAEVAGWVRHAKSHHHHH